MQLYQHIYVYKTMTKKFNLKRNIIESKNNNVLNSEVIPSTYRSPRTVRNQPNKDAKTEALFY